MSLSDYLLAEIRRVSALPTMEEMRERLRRRERVDGALNTARAVREERERR